LNLLAASNLKGIKLKAYLEFPSNDLFTAFNNLLFLAQAAQLLSELKLHPKCHQKHCKVVQSLVQGIQSLVQGYSKLSSRPFKGSKGDI
jgi:hypothetical protein